VHYSVHASIGDFKKRSSNRSQLVLLANSPNVSRASFSVPVVLPWVSVTFRGDLVAWWCNNNTLDLRLSGRGFDSGSGRYQVVSTWMGDCLWTGKPSRYIT